MPDDHDNPWKVALERFLADCLRLLFPAIYFLIDSFPHPTSALHIASA